MIPNNDIEMQIGRLEFAPLVDWSDPRLTAAAPCVPTPGYTVMKFPPFSEPKFYWLIEVKFDGDERAARYFTGECEPGWHGVTTINPGHAQKYSSRCLAQIDILKLAPRLIGEWVAREHGFS